MRCTGDAINAFFLIYGYINQNRPHIDLSKTKRYNAFAKIYFAYWEEVLYFSSDFFSFVTYSCKEVY